MSSQTVILAHLFHSNTSTCQTYLVAQWLRNHQPMQGTQVWSLVQEDSTCCGATKPVYCNYWPCVLSPHTPEPVLHERSRNNEKSPHRNESSSPLLHLEKACAQQRRPSTAKNKWINKLKKKNTNICTFYNANVADYILQKQPTAIFPVPLAPPAPHHTSINFSLSLELGRPLWFPWQKEQGKRDSTWLTWLAHKSSIASSWFSLSRCLPWEPSHHVVRRLRTHENAT